MVRFSFISAFPFSFLDDLALTLSANECCSHRGEGRGQGSQPGTQELSVHPPRRFLEPCTYSLLKALAMRAISSLHTTHLPRSAQFCTPFLCAHFCWIQPYPLRFFYADLLTQPCPSSDSNAWSINKTCESRERESNGVCYSIVTAEFEIGGVTSSGSRKPGRAHSDLPPPSLQPFLSPSTPPFLLSPNSPSALS